MSCPAVASTRDVSEGDFRMSHRVKAGAGFAVLVKAYLMKEIKRSLKIRSLFQLIEQSVQGT